ncbi:fatty acid desaturase [Mycolicibacterium doricum]|uniref:fatty acid desaturase n=1 Tax=Mycolicibacterium doricum TaxID=126673 RepID=UPI000A164B4B|nr:fatty acid desaturase [Mycolicibacterium doricum]MCV7268642.1 fatty acid desaturase [Mycolicibacterium doricum]
MTALETSNVTRLASHRELKRGYSTPPSIRGALAEMHETSLLKSVATVGADHVLAACSLGIAGRTGSQNAVIRAFCMVAASTVCARAFRGLENLVHEASHFNWSRDRRELNDRLSILLAAAPVGVKLSTYRAEHLLHHGKFGSESDPDFIRYRELGIDDLDRTNVWRFTGMLARKFVRYQQGWFKSSSGSFIRSFALPSVYASALILPQTRWIGSRGVIHALVCWMLTTRVTLPLIRFVAESSEHRFTGRTSVFEATISNLGWFQKVLFHPHGDGYHTIHHLWPGIPHHKVAATHRLLMSFPEGDYAQKLRYRTKLFESDRSQTQ